MRKSQILLGSLALLSMGLYSCSSEEPANNGNNTTVDGDRYMAVRISTAGMGTRAVAEDTNYENAAKGSNEANLTAKTVRFYFFDQDGNAFKMEGAPINGTVSSTNMVAPTAINTVSETNGDAVITGTLVLGRGSEGFQGMVPAKVLCVANADDFDQYANKAFANVVKVLETSVKATDAESWTNFVMTSSSYVDGNAETFTSTVTDKIKGDVASAENDPVQIYIERLAAKVRVQGLGVKPAQAMGEDGKTPVNTKFNIYKADGSKEEVDINVELTGWQLRNTASESFGVKNIVANGNYFADWNNADLHRSYWAVSPTNVSVNNDSFDIHAASQFALGNFSSTSPLENIAYCYENTAYTPNGVTDRTSDATAIVIKGIVKRADTGEALNLVKWAGALYEESNLLQLIVNSVNDANLGVGDIEFIQEVNNMWKACRKSDTEHKPIANFERIQRWIGGETSYYANIEHFGGKFGVVRNHIYDYTLTNVIGLGVPGNDETTDDEVQTFVAAAINVLTWRVVSNSLILQ